MRNGRSLFRRVLHYFGGFGRWRARRKRAVCLGDMGHARLWYDPETEDIWQAKTRFGLFAVPSDSSVESTIQMLDHVHRCELYVDPEDFEVAAHA